MLCVPLTPIPLDPDRLPQPTGDTTRERTESLTSGAVCNGCHKMINPFGFAFESFDQVGRYRTMDNGHPVNTTATVQFGEGEQIALDGFHGESSLTLRVTMV